ncbi:hypothetical protein PENTCL1PPCAC_10424, partial [Pristionchus entomophagus]
GGGGGGRDWDSQQAGTSMQQLQLQPRSLQQHQQHPVVALATSRGVQQQQKQQGGMQHKQQPQQQQYHNGREHSRNRNWNGGNSQHQQPRNQQSVQHHHSNGQQRQTQQVQQSQQPNQRQVQQTQQQLQQRNEQQANRQRGKRRRHNTGFYQDRAAEQHGGGAAAAAADPSSDELPGFTRCPTTGKYFRITADGSGLVGHRVSDVRAAERKKKEEEEAKRRREEDEERRRQCPPPLRPTTLSLLSSLSLGRLRGPALPRAAAAARMQQLPATPTQVIDVDDFLPLSRYSGMESIVGCEFLEVSVDGETLTGCWAVAGSSGGRVASMACSVRTSVEERGGGGRREREQKWLGLDSLRGTPVQVRASAIVDMAMAPTDRDVTCLLYTTATSTLDWRGVPITVCDVSTRPVYCRFDETGNYDVSDADLYNVQTRLNGNVYSCAWEQKSMRIGLGLEDHAELHHVMTDEIDIVDTQNKQPISQAFNESGDTLFLGLQRANARIVDMRESMDRAAAIIPGSRSTGWLRLLKKSGPQVVMSTLEGKLCLYDIRRPVIPLLSYEGNATRGGVRLPTFVDHDEQFVFAVGADFWTRVWSLSSGDLLHSLAPPTAATPPTHLSDYPRPVYSTRWAGAHGHGALLVAAGNQINVYRLGQQEEE